MKPHKPIRILYVEDNEETQEMMTILLGFSDIEITAAETVVKAWRLSQANYFDLYLLDSQFPDGNGFELCRRLRENASHIPIVFYSGNARETDKQKGFASGADAYLEKLNLNDVISTILQFTRRSVSSRTNRNNSKMKTTKRTRAN